MSLSSARVRAGSGHRPHPSWPRWLVIGALGWAGVVALGAQLYALRPPRAGFDLELLLVAGRRVAAGASAYEPAMLAGRAPAAADLFYSYPPPVAQYLALFAPVPSPLMLVAFGVAAVVGLLAVATVLWRATTGDPRADARGPLALAVLPVLAMAPFVWPFAVALLFGNLDALFPLLYGLMLLGALVPTVAARFAGGAGLAVAAVAKLHPASMGLWFLVRGARDRPQAGQAVPGGWLVAGAGAAMALAIVAVSVLVGGTGPWADYVTALRVGSNADIVDARNVGPAAQAALLSGSGEGAARLLQVLVTTGALAVTVVAAWRLEDTLESFAWAAFASLVVLPVTWFHYPVALMPVALVAWLRAGPAVRRVVNGLLLASIAIAVIAVAVPVVVWASVALVLAAVRRGVPATEPHAALQPSRVSRFPVPGARG